jgi:hypothetical protein
MPVVWEGSSWPEVRRDYLQGLLDLMPAGGPSPTNSSTPGFRFEIEEKLRRLPQEIFVGSGGFGGGAGNPPPPSPALRPHLPLLGRSAQPIESWTMGALGLPREEAQALLRRVVQTSRHSGTPDRQPACLGGEVPVWC